MIRVFLADDHRMFREGIRRILAETTDVCVVGEAGTGNEVLSACTDSAWDVLLLDLTLPGQNGLDVLYVMQNRYPDIAVLILSMHAEEQFAVRALRGGASGYLTKDSAPEVLIHAIRRAHAGGKYVSEKLGEHLVASTMRTLQCQPHELLSDREFQVFLGIAQGRKPIELAAEMSLSPKTIDTYRRRVLGKMNLATNADVVRYALDNALIE